MVPFSIAEEGQVVGGPLRGRTAVGGDVFRGLVLESRWRPIITPFLPPCPPDYRTGTDKNPHKSGWRGLLSDPTGLSGVFELSAAMWGDNTCLFGS